MCKISSKKKWLFWGSRLSPFATHTPWLQNNGIWVEADPEQQVITTMQVHQGDQPRLPPSCIASLACVCMLAACPLLEGEKKKKEKFYIYPDVTNTHTHQWFLLGVLSDFIWPNLTQTCWRQEVSDIATRSYIILRHIWKWICEWFYHLLSVGP